MKKLFSTEGPLIGFLDKVGQLILLSICWILGCLPVVTVGTSTTALYYAVMKSIRRDRGYSLGEFWRSYKANLGRGILATAPMLLIAAVLCLNVWILYNAEEQNSTLLVGCVLCLALMGCTWIYVCPVLSRFTMRVRDVWKLSFVMALRFIPFTLAIAAGFAVLAALQIWVLPVPTMLVLPGAWCYVTTFMMEKALRRYMPAKQENDDAWYYE